MILANSKDKERYLILLLFFSSFLLGLYEITIIKEFSVSTDGIQTITTLFFAFLHIFFGVGSYIANAFFDALIDKKNIKTILLLTGIAVIFSLFSVLAASGMNIIWLVTNIFSVSLAFTSMGIIYGLILIYFCRQVNDRIGVIVATSLLGLMLGFLIEPYLAVHVGVNAIVLLIGIFFALLYVDSPYFFFPALIAILVLYLHFPVDSTIERLRKIEAKSRYGVTYKSFKKNFKEVFNGWSPYVKLNIFRHKERNELKGAYNYQFYWTFNLKEQGYRTATCGFIRDSDKVVLIGASAGQEIDRLPRGRNSTYENTTMVEIDPTVVKYFQIDHPEYNDFVYKRINVIAADGRNVLDEMKEKKDVIIIGTLESPGRNMWMLSEFKNNLYTIESLRRCFEILEDDGVLMIYRDENNPLLAASICAVFKKLKVHFNVFKIMFTEGANHEKINRFYIYASRNELRIAAMPEMFRTAGVAFETVQVEDAPFLTDDRNFTNLFMPAGKLALKTFLLLLGIMGLSGLLVFLFAGKKMRRHAILYFLLIGAGFFLTQLFLMAKFRSFFRHPFKTILIVTLIFFSSVALGNILSRRIKTELLKKRLHLHGAIVLLILLSFQFSASHIPFFISDYPGKLLVAMLIILPIGLLCGFYFPLALSLNKNKNIGLAVFFDSLGTCIGFLLFYIVYWFFGLSANFYPIAFCYMAATILISR